MDVCDLSMVQRSQNLRFTFEASHALSVIGEKLRQNFQCDFALQLGIAGAVNLAHAARTQQVKDLI